MCLQEGQTLLITLATLGEEIVKGERAVLKVCLNEGEPPLTVCTLVPFVQESCVLDLPISKRTFTFTLGGTAKGTKVHLLGRMVNSFVEDDSVMSDLPMEEQYARMMGGSGMPGEEYEDDDSSEDGDWNEEEDEEEEDEGDSASSSEGEEEDGGDDEDDLEKRIAEKFPNRSTFSADDVNASDDDDDEDADEEEQEEEEDDDDDDDEEEQPKVSTPNNKKRGRESPAKPVLTPKRPRADSNGSQGMPSATPESATSAVNGTPKSSAKKSAVSRATVLDKIHEVVKAHKFVTMSDLGQKLGVSFKAGFKKLGHGSPKGFIEGMDSVSLKNGTVTMKKKSWQ